MVTMQPIPDDLPVHLHRAWVMATFDPAKAVQQDEEFDFFDPRTVLGGAKLIQEFYAENELKKENTALRKQVEQLQSDLNDRDRFISQMQLAPPPPARQVTPPGTANRDLRQLKIKRVS